MTTAKKRIYELTKIDSFLRSSGLVDITDIRHFTIINDNWALANNPGRSSGSAWFVRVQPSAGIHKYKTSYTDTTRKTTGTNTDKFFNLVPVIGFEKYVPANLKWQHNMYVSVSWSPYWTDQHSRSNINRTESETSQSSHQSEAVFYGSYGIGYYPNNRTTLNATIGMEARRLKYNDHANLKSSALLKPSLNFSTDYFISYRTRFSASWNMFYTKSFTDPVLGSRLTAHHFTTGFGAGLVHYIF